MATFFMKTSDVPTNHPPVLLVHLAGITSTSNTSHEEMKQTALKRDEEQVQAIVNNLNENMTDSFDIEAHPPCLMNISTEQGQISDSLFLRYHLSPSNLI
jgi:hypothetical protein